MTKKTNKHRNFLHDLSYTLKERIDDILDTYDDEDYVDAISLTYYDIITILKEGAWAYGIDEKDIALDIIDEDDILKIPSRFLQRKTGEKP